MSSIPKVSVVVAAYNQAQYLPQALESALAQDLGPDLFEVVVVDDGSTDETPTLLSRYADRVIMLRQAHQGLPAACNAGFAQARGAYVARLDADDFVDPAWLRRELDVLDSTPGACCVYPDYVQVFADGTQRPMVVEPDNLYSFIACGTMFRTAMIRATGGVRHLFWEEYDLYLRLQGLGTFAHLAQPLYFYRHHASGMTSDAQARRAGWQQLIQLWGSQRLLAAGSCPELAEAIAMATPSPAR